MWKYTHTDEMYHSLTCGNDELFHSAVYLGTDFSDGIKHFKYIKREKVNGKWVYTYRHDEYENAKAADRANIPRLHAVHDAKQKAAENARLAKDAEASAEWKRKRAVEDAGSNKNPFKKKKLARNVSDKTSEAALATAKRAVALQEEEKANSEYDALMKDIKKTSANYTKVANRTAVRRAVGEATTKALNKASDTHYKAKNKVKDIINQAKKKKKKKNSNRTTIKVRSTRIS